MIMILLMAMAFDSMLLDRSHVRFMEVIQAIRTAWTGLVTDGLLYLRAFCPGKPPI